MDKTSDGTCNNVAARPFNKQGETAGRRDWPAS